MAKNNKEKSYRVKKKRHKIGFWTKAVALVIIGYFVMSFYQQHVERKELEAEMESLQQEKAEIEERIDNLEAILRTGDSDEAIEKLARENLRMKKPGEKVYILDPINSLNQDLLDGEETGEEGEEDQDEEDENGQEEDP